MMTFLHREVEITNKLGFHARAASQFVKLAGKFQADILIEKEGVRTNGKSIMGILMLAAPKGSRLILRTRGADAEAALEALSELIENRFNEE
jgi:phosphocarrier protein